MVENKLVKVTQYVEYKQNVEPYIDVPNFSKIYSYIMYAVYNKNQLIGFNIEYSISQNQKLNTLFICDIIKDIKQHIADITQKASAQYVVSYKQPDISLQYELFQPFVHKLAKEIYRLWGKYYDFDDVLQICNMVMVILYNKGYYLNSKILRKSVINYILADLRKERDKPTTVSINHGYNTEDGVITLEDLIPDNIQVEQREDAELTDYLDFITKQKRELIIELIGKRQYDQLMREYGTKTVSPYGRKLVYEIKTELDKLGITSRTFFK